MTISDGEKLLLIMIAEMHKSAKVKGEIDPDFVLAAIHDDQTWGLRWKYPGIFTSPVENPPVVKETCDILDMYRVLPTAFDRLSAADKKRIEADAGPSFDFVRYRGFDGNNDDHLSVVKFLVRKLGLYEEIKAPDLDSHTSSTLGKYRRMVAAYQGILDRDKFSTSGLGADDIIAILKA